MLSIITYVLDDDKEDIEILRPFLERVCKRCELMLFTDVEAFVDAIEEGAHIGIIDHRLNAGIDGIEVGKRVKKKNRFAQLILFSGSSDKRVWQRATNSGFCGLVDKGDPDCYEQIAVMVERMIPDLRSRIEEWSLLTRMNEKYKAYQ